MAEDQLESHPLATIFPLMEGVVFRDLVEDIRVNGLREPIVLLDGKILDGRNRYRAAHAAQVGVRFRMYDGKDALAFVVSANLHRRHLDASQRAMVAAEIRRVVEGSARGPKPKPLPADRYAGRGKMQPLKNPNGAWAARRTANVESAKRATDLRIAVANSRVTAEDAAAIMNVSAPSVRQATAVLERGVPELVAAVRSGVAAVSAAAEVASLPAKQQREILASKGVDAVAVIGRQAKDARLQERRVNRASDGASGVAVFDHIKIGDGRSIGNVRLGECSRLASDLRCLASILEAVAGHCANSDDQKIRDLMSEEALSAYFVRARSEVA